MKKLFAVGAILIVGWFLVFLFLPALQEDLPSLRDHVKEMKGEYPALEKVQYRYAQGDFQVDLYVENLDEAAVIKEELKSFLASEPFLSEFLPWAEEKVGWGESTFGKMPPYPDISISCTQSGEEERSWASFAMYYAEPYRSDQDLEVDGYQTWDDAYY